MIDIVPSSSQHADGVVSLILPIQQTEFNIPITLDAQPDLRDIPGFYQQDNGNFWVALDDGKVVGTVALLDIGNSQAALRKMFVSVTHRGAGAWIGQAFAGDSLGLVPSTSCARVLLGNQC